MSRQRVHFVRYLVFVCAAALGSTAQAGGLRTVAELGTKRIGLPFTGSVSEVMRAVRLSKHSAVMLKDNNKNPLGLVTLDGIKHAFQKCRAEVRKTGKAAPVTAQSLILATREVGLEQNIKGNDEIRSAAARIFGADKKHRVLTFLGKGPDGKPVIEGIIDNGAVTADFANRGQSLRGDVHRADEPITYKHWKTEPYGWDERVKPGSVYYTEERPTGTQSWNKVVKAADEYSRGSNRSIKDFAAKGISSVTVSN
jgi:hypothetical protein